MIYRGSYENAVGEYDLIIADPPYKVTQCRWDRGFAMADAWVVFKKILTRTGVVIVHCMQPFTTEVMSAAPAGWFRYELIWEKTKATLHLESKRRPLSAHENILVFSPAVLGRHTYNAQMTIGTPYAGTKRREARTTYGTIGGTRKSNNGFRYPRSIITTKAETGWHPTRKPVDLAIWLVKTYSNPTDRVLEPFGGSCPVHKACTLSGRQCDSYELDNDYFKRTTEAMDL